MFYLRVEVGDGLSTHEHFTRTTRDRPTLDDAFSNEQDGSGLLVSTSMESIDDLCASAAVPTAAADGEGFGEGEGNHAPGMSLQIMPKECSKRQK